MSPECRAVGSALRAHRKRRGLLGLQAAIRFNVSPASWSRYESGLQEMPPDLLAAVAERWQAWDLLCHHPVARATVASLDVARQQRAMRRESPVLIAAWAYPDGRLEAAFGGESPPPTRPGGAGAMCA